MRLTLGQTGWLSGPGFHPYLVERPQSFGSACPCNKGCFCYLFVVIFIPPQGSPRILPTAMWGVFGKSKTRCRCVETRSAVMVGHPCCLSTHGRPKDRAHCEPLALTPGAMSSKEPGCGWEGAGKCRHVQPTPLTHLQPLFWKPEVTQMQNQQSKKSRDL